MKVYNWKDFFINPQIASEIMESGTGISIGSFDGIHSGHRKLLETLVQNSHVEKLNSGVVTFIRPLPSIKHSFDYAGDLTTLQQRLELFEQYKIDFVIVVDFDDTFAARSGTEFLNLLVNLCNLKMLAEGVDFRCGYKGATDTTAIADWAGENNIKTFFVPPVYMDETSQIRISSSFVRNMIAKGDFEAAKKMLNRPYELDFSGEIDRVNKSEILQVLPPDGKYKCINEAGREISLEITAAELIFSHSAKKIIF